MSCGCGNSGSWSCTNPCAAGSTNTAACETLPSALDNFIKHFFGSVIKTEVNGQVTWSLPCHLDVGLNNNPRSTDEGLACYFLRLFEDGIIGLTGPAGPAGNNGTNGFHAFTVTIESFAQPVVGGVITVKAVAHPAFSVGETIFMTGSGWYDIQAVSGDGSLVLTLLQGVSGVSGLQTAGRLVVITGPRGITGATGGQGTQGPIGPQGLPGDEYTPVNNYVHCAGMDFLLPAVIDTQVTFAPGATEPEITLPTPGEYIVTVIVGITMINPLTTPGTTPSITIKMWNATTAAFEADLEQFMAHMTDGESGQIVSQAIVQTTVPNETLQLYAAIGVANNATAIASRTSVSYVRLS